MKNNFSTNMLKTYQKCPFLYKLIYEDNISIPQSSLAGETGRTIHRLIDYYFKGFDISNMLKSLSNKELELWNNFVSFNINPKEIFESEYVFNVKFSSFWVNGRIDAIHFSNDTYTIFDWKTGKIPKNPETDLQTALYSLALYNILLNQNKIKSIEQINFCYFNLNSKQKETININDRLLHVYNNEISGIVDNISERNFTQKLTQSKMCQFCNLQYLCI